MRARREDGFTLVEVSAALLVSFLALFGLLAAFDGAVRGSHTAERESAAAAVAQQHLEKILARPYAEVVNCTTGGTTPAPGGADESDPRFLVGAGSPPTFRIRARPRIAGDTQLVAGTPAAGEPFVLSTATNCIGADATTDGTGIVAGPLPVTADPQNRLFGAKVYRFVTWYDENGCLLNQATAVNAILQGVVSLVNSLLSSLTSALQTNLTALCGRTQDAKRITVAVVLPSLGNNAGVKKPVYLSTMLPDPTAGTGIGG